MGVVAFNTYDFVKDLKDAGIDEKHAAAISNGILRAHEVADLATKADLQEVKTELQELRTQTKADLRELELRMTIKLGSMMIVAVGVIGVMIKFL